MLKFVIGNLLGAGMAIGVLVYLELQPVDIDNSVSNDSALPLTTTADTNRITQTDEPLTENSSSHPTPIRADAELTNEPESNDYLSQAGDSIVDENVNRYGIPYLLPGQKPIEIDGDVSTLLNDKPIAREFTGKSSATTRRFKKSAPRRSKVNKSSRTWQFAKAHRDLENENWDIQWSYYIETSFLNFVLNRDYFAESFAEVFIECRSSACEFQLTSHPIDRSNDTGHWKARSDYEQLLYDIASEHWWKSLYRPPKLSYFVRHKVGKRSIAYTNSSILKRLE